jgi:hypothetical protein
MARGCNVTGALVRVIGVLLLILIVMVVGSWQCPWQNKTPELEVAMIAQKPANADQAHR